MSRRTYLLAGGAGATIISGCLDDSAAELVIVETGLTQPEAESDDGRRIVEILLSNEGAGADVRVRVETVDQAGDIVDSFGKNLFMRHGAQRLISLEIRLDPSVSKLEYRANPL